MLDECQEKKHRCPYCKQEVLHDAVENHWCAGRKLRRAHKREHARLEDIDLIARDLLATCMDGRLPQSIAPVDDAIFLATEYVDRILKMHAEIEDRQKEEFAAFEREQEGS